MPNLAELAAKEIRDNQRMRDQLEYLLADIDKRADLFTPQYAKTAIEKILRGDSNAQ